MRIVKAVSILVASKTDVSINKSSSSSASDLPSSVLTSRLDLDKSTLLPTSIITAFGSADSLISLSQQRRTFLKEDREVTSTEGKGVEYESKKDVYFFFFYRKQ